MHFDPMESQVQTDTKAPEPRVKVQKRNVVQHELFLHGELAVMLP